VTEEGRGTIGLSEADLARALLQMLVSHPPCGHPNARLLSFGASRGNLLKLVIVKAMLAVLNRNHFTMHYLEPAKTPKS
jgi:hypothetical protein